MKVSKFINNHLVWLILLAAGSGFILPQFSFLSNYVSLALFVMILGLGLTVEFREFVAVVRTPWKVLIPIFVQYSVIPLGAFLLTFFITSKDLAIGILVLGAAPSEITSALMVHFAQGNLALGTTIMAFSIVVAPFVMPGILTVFTGESVNIDALGMIENLLLTVVLAVLLGSFVRTKYKRLEKYKEEFSSLSSLMVVFLIFVVSSASRDEILDTSPVELVELALLLLILNIFGYFIGYLTAKIFRLGEFKSYIFTIGMKEFGVATAIALQFFGSEAAIPAAIYGVIMLITAPLIAKTALLKRLGQ